MKEKRKMLVVSRKEGESILVGDNIEIVVLGVRGDRIRVGISAPRQVSIVRKELKAVGDENIQAVGKTELENMKKLTSLLNNTEIKQKNKL